MHKLALNVDGLELSQSSPAVFETRIMSTGASRIVLSVPDAHPDLLGRLAALLTPPFFVLYILHTPRGEGEPGRYQSSELSRHELDDLLSRYTAFFASDGRHDLWVHSPASGHTLI